MEITDAVLVERCLAGNSDAYGELVRRHQDAVFNLLVKMTGNWHEAADLTEDAFVRAFQRLAAYDARFSFKNWVITIAVNLTKNRFRSLFRRRRVEQALAAEVERPVPAAAPDDPRLEAVDQALARMPEDYRAPLILRHLEGYSYDEIAQTLGIGVSAAKMRVLRARDALVQQLGHTRKDVNR
jgi:RNA polymerase sigma-70 factor, ECF subfamily